MKKYSIEGKRNTPNYVSSKIIQESLATYSGSTLLTHLKLVDRVLQTNINRSYDLFKRDILFNLGDKDHTSKDDVNIDENEDLIKTLKFILQQASNAFDKETKCGVNNRKNHNNLEKIRNEFKDILSISNKKFVKKRQQKGSPAGFNCKMDHMINSKKLEINESNSLQTKFYVLKKENSAISPSNLMETQVWSGPLKAVLVVF